MLENQKTVIKSLTGIKVVALLLIFYSHSAMPQIELGIGSRMCELLFVMSGFLVGYNKLDKKIPCTYKASFDYFISKFILFYPLHVIITLLRAIIQYKYLFDIKNLIKLFLSLLLLNSWSPFEDTFFCFNGSSWFLSALLFCYFLTPLFLRLTKNEKPLYFILILFIRLFIDIVTNYTSFEIIPVHTHVNPFVRSLEFFLGMLSVPYYMKLKNYVDSTLSINKKRILFSILEITIVLITIVLMYYLNNICIPKTFFVFLFCIFVFIFAFDSGILSICLGINIFKLFNKIQFEFYLSHTTFFLYCWAIVSKMNINTKPILLLIIELIIEFILLVLICFIYVKYFKNFFACKLEKIILKLTKF